MNTFTRIILMCFYLLKKFSRKCQKTRFLIRLNAIFYFLWVESFVYPYRMQILNILKKQIQIWNIDQQQFLSSFSQLTRVHFDKLNHAGPKLKNDLFFVRRQVCKAFLSLHSSYFQKNRFSFIYFKIEYYWIRKEIQLFVHFVCLAK